jgi:uncharacterized membrane-anchored protein
MKKIPTVDSKYWLSLVFASVFGANAGDYLADGLGLGHLSGLPVLALILTGLFAAEKLDRTGSMFYYWAAIITVRASATNIGDIFHDIHASFAVSVPLTIAGLIAVLLAWRQLAPSSLKNNTIPVNHFYWISMFFAGVVGTVGGDATSYALGFGNFYAMLALGALLVILLWVGQNGWQTQLFYYWLTIAMIRSAGTAAGDLFAHLSGDVVANHEWGIGISTVCTGIVFIVMTYMLYREPNFQPAVKSSPNR